MKNTIVILVILATAALSGCAQTAAYKDGRCIFRSQANAKLITFRNADIELRVEDLDHSTPTRAGGSVVGTTGAAVMAVVASTAMRGAR